MYPDITAAQPTICFPEPSMPQWLLILSVFIGLGAGIAVVIDLVLRLWKTPSLKLILTNELFFRLLQSGECLYINAILIAYDYGVLVENVIATLEKTETTANKILGLHIQQIGEKQRLERAGHEFYFYSDSPVCFVADNNVLRIVYLCTYKAYEEKTRQSFISFFNELSLISEKVKSFPIPWSEEVEREMISEASGIVEKYIVAIMEDVQIEDGDYRLSLEISYRQRRNILPLYVMKIAKAEPLTFKIDRTARETLRNQLKRHLEGIAFIQITGKAPPIPTPAPEYRPLDIKEAV